MTINKVVKSGQIAEGSNELAGSRAAFTGKNMNLAATIPEDFLISMLNEQQAARVIKVLPGKILTEQEILMVSADHGDACPDLSRDILKIAVLERHRGTGAKTVGFVKGFQLERGAIATSINHDSHNVIAVGTSNVAMQQAVNHLIAIDGGIVVWDGQDFTSLALPVGGLMTHESPESVAEALQRLKAAAKSIGCNLAEPFLQLSFLALPVIPDLKITDQGLVDVTRFEKVSVFPDEPNQ